MIDVLKEKVNRYYEALDLYISEIFCAKAIYYMEAKQKEIIMIKFDPTL